jgi:hypothetical protein
MPITCRREQCVGVCRELTLCSDLCLICGLRGETDYVLGCIWVMNVTHTWNYVTIFSWCE